ncbi:tryptophan ABC transporter substrate-binding protein [Pediococcus cellicola]|nr:tryptophan ABC transporter substrate-binding protein [Pediococcus cellicola]GEL15602.1 ABC transporter substrate-binding protein [Pediococcus cellicola]
MKRLITFVTAIILFLGFAFFQGNSEKTTKAKIPTVGILQLMNQPALEQIQKGVISGLKREGYVKGKTVKIDYQNAQGNQSNLKTMSERFANENADLMIGITTPSSQALADVTQKTPIVLGAVTDPKGARLVKNEQQPEANITGVSDQAPLKEQLDLILKLMPNLKTLGIIYTSSDNSAVTQYKLFKKLCQQENVTLKAYSISNSNDLNQVSQTMLQKVDAAYVPTDNTIAGAMQTLVKNANNSNVPVFPAVDSMVKQGGVATYSVNQYKLGVMTGKMAGRLLKGQKVKDTPVEYVKHGDLTINLKQAKKLGIHIPESLIQKAQKKGELFK